MTKDLEDTLAAMGPGYRSVVERLVAGADAEPSPRLRAMRFPRRSRAAARAPLLAAASILVLLGASVFMLMPDEQSPAGHLRVAAREYLLAETPGREAVDELIRSQNADGSWGNDFLTRRNAAALSKFHDAQAKVAYKKAMRNLRVRGVL